MALCKEAVAGLVATRRSDDVSDQLWACLWDTAAEALDNRSMKVLELGIPSAQELGILWDMESEHTTVVPVALSGRALGKALVGTTGRGLGTALGRKKGKASVFSWVYSLVVRGLEHMTRNPHCHSLRRLGLHHNSAFHTHSRLSNEPCIHL
jgi:hypothetical protein